MLVEYLIAWKEMARQIREKRRKDALYKTLVGSELNYMIIQDLVNAARYDVVIKITTKDGARLEITRKEPIARPPLPPGLEGTF